MIDEYALIDCIKVHEELYNRDHPEYMNQLLRDTTWREIADKFGENCAVIKEKWHRIRENYRKALILRTKKMEAGAKIRPPKYHKELSFLVQHLNDDNLFTLEITSASGAAENDPDEQSDSSLSNPPRKVIKRSHSVELTTEEVMLFDSRQPQNTNIGADPVLTEFFVNMANTVAQFPLSKQLEIKGKLFEMVHAAEMEIAANGRDILG